MIKGVSIIKTEKIQHNDDYYLIGASEVNNDDKSIFVLTIMLNGYKNLGEEYAGSLNDLLEKFEIVRQKYIEISKQ